MADWKPRIISIPARPAVYIFSFMGWIPLYVGATQNLRSRLAGHGFPRKLVDSVGIKISWKVVRKCELIILEDAMLQALKPAYNSGNRSLRNYKWGRANRHSRSIEEMAK
jgi:excinuclease UvrABC nuclease subunit